MSHCEWRPIEEAQKFGDEKVYVWENGDLIEAVWDRRHKSDELSWCQIYRERDGDDLYKLEPQPKYYLAVKPPPEE